MADTSFQDGDLFIGLGEESALNSGGPSTPSTLRDAPGKGKKRKAEQSGNSQKRQRHQTPPKPLTSKQKKKQKGKGKGKEAAASKQQQLQQQRQQTNVRKGSPSSRRTPWADDVNWDQCRDPAEMLNDEVQAFYNYITPTEAEYTIRKLLIETITGHIVQWKPDVEVVAFGSWQTQLYLPTGDLDLVVVPPPGVPYSANQTRKFLTQLSVVLRKSGVADKIALVLGAKVPIVKFVTRPQYGNIAVDISFAQVGGISAGKIMTHYLDALPGSRELITVIKYFLSQRSMNEVFTGGLGSYSVICLVISFMQMHPKLRRCEMDAQRNLGTLLLEFFELYGRSFNYEAIGISLRRGGSYFLKSARGWQQKSGNPAPFLLSIEDPQNPDHDISSGSYGLAKVKLTFGGAYDMLRQRMFDRSAQILARNTSDKSTKLPSSPGEWSILSCVTSVGEDVFTFRDHLSDLHARGRIASDLDMFIAHTGLDVRLQNPPLRPVVAAAQRAERTGHPSSSDMELESSSGEADLSVGGAIVIDDDEEGAISDGASSHTDDSSVVAFEPSVSVDEDLYDSADESRYAAASATANRVSERREARPGGRSNGSAQNQSKATQRVYENLSAEKIMAIDAARVADEAEHGKARDPTHSFTDDGRRRSTRIACKAKPSFCTQPPPRGGVRKGSHQAAAAVTTTAGDVGGDAKPKPVIPDIADDACRAYTQTALAKKAKGGRNPETSDDESEGGEVRPTTEESEIPAPTTKRAPNSAKSTGPSASAGPSRTTTPPLKVVGQSAASAPSSPAGRPLKWVRPTERAAYWANKSQPIDLTGDSSD